MHCDQCRSRRCAAIVGINCRVHGRGANALHGTIQQARQLQSAENYGCLLSCGRCNACIHRQDRRMLHAMQATPSGYVSPCSAICSLSTPSGSSIFRCFVSGDVQPGIRLSLGVVVCKSGLVLNSGWLGHAVHHSFMTHLALCSGCGSACTVSQPKYLHRTCHSSC